MPNANIVILMGNVTRDIELTYTPRGTACCNLGIATNKYWTTDSGEKMEKATFVDVTLWGRNAELAGEYLKKGHPVYIEGELELDQWDDKTTGQKRSRLKVVASAMQLLGQKSGHKPTDEDADAHLPQRNRQAPLASTPPPASNALPPKPKPTPVINLDDRNDIDDDIPF